MGEGGEPLEFVGVLDATALLRQFLVHLHLHVLQVLVARAPVQDKLDVLRNVVGGAAVAGGRRGRGHDGRQSLLLLMMMMMVGGGRENAVAALRDVVSRPGKAFSTSLSL
jgi:hypothetical protein